MTPQERDLLDRFLSDLTQARPGPKDAEAAQRIEQTLRANPDAAYVLVQHAIMADQALNDAQSQIAQMQAQMQGQGGPPQGQGGGFLGGGYGAGQGGYGQPGYAQGGYPPAATAVPPTGGGMFGGGAPGPGPFSGGGGLGSFLRSAGTTAAGVAGGAFLFEGLSGMFGGHHGGGFGGFGGGENVTINEFGGDGGREGFADGGGYDGGGSDFDYDDN